MTEQILILVFLIILNGLFAMSEIAIVSSRKSRLEELMRKGSKKAKLVLHLSESPNRFLSTIQVGITLIAILIGVFGGTGLARSYQRRPALTAERPRIRRARSAVCQLGPSAVRGGARSLPIPS